MAQKIIDVPGYGLTEFPDSMTDEQIAKAIQSQHPELAPKPAEPAKMGMLEGMGRMVVNDPMVRGPAEAIVGAAKDVGSTGLGLVNLGQRALGNPQFQKPEWMQPKNGPQKMGAALSTIGQFAIPGAATSNITSKAPLIVRALAEGLGSGGVSLARGDTGKDAGRNAYTTAGITAALGGAGKLAGPFGERIELALLKPLKADLEDVRGPAELAPQTMVQNLFKYDLGGTLPQSYKKAQELTKSLGQQLRRVMGPSTAQIDLFDALRKTTTELRSARAGTFGDNANIAKAVERILNEIRIVSRNGKVNIADAQDVKQAIGAMGAWQHGLRDDEAKAMETVANALYSKVKTAIEQSSGHSADVQAINKQFSEVIPIKNALIRRIPVAARREPVSLKEFIALSTGNVKGVGLALADRAMRSGTVANALVQAGKAPTANAARVAPRLTGSMDALIKALQQSN